MHDIESMTWYRCGRLSTCRQVTQSYVDRAKECGIATHIVGIRGEYYDAKGYVAEAINRGDAVPILLK
jgi:hypothetical protein